MIWRLSWDPSEERKTIITFICLMLLIVYYYYNWEKIQKSNINSDRNNGLEIVFNQFYISIE